ncbi:fused DSP-PTPase phosphatase/NAD kinase-like protein [Aliikangiella sp. IMCC44359]|uniref:fused DSP-PTPase phosphatase/NAD kinase-like protein n=1 Tax=Aliikangiella sp. IMCC44359 TaxID=3459125 RepID=UPI00403B2033
MNNYVEKFKSILHKSLLGYLCLLLGTSTVIAEKLELLKNTDFNQVETQGVKLITGGQPSKEELYLLSQSGVKTIINLRNTNEFDGFDEATLVGKLGIKYISIPVAGAKGITVDNAIKLDQALAKTKGLTLVHCASGNRVGALLALRENLIKGSSIDDSILLGQNAGLKSLKDKTLSLMQKK